MNEIAYQDLIVKLLNKKFEEKEINEFEARRGSPVIYELYLKENLELNINNLNLITNKKEGEKPSRGHGAFETDVAIFKTSGNKDIPFLIIEIKNKITSHDIIIYSHKAMKHKQVLPFLRYGLIAYGIKTIPGRFFKHNENIDFFLTVEKYIENKKIFANMLYELFEKELENFDKLKIINNSNSNKFNFYQKINELKNF